MHEVLLQGHPKGDIRLSLPASWEELRVEHVPAVIVARTVAWQTEHPAWQAITPPTGQDRPPFILRGHDAGLRLALFRELTGLPTSELAAGEPVFAIQVKLKSNTIDANGQARPLQSGMWLEADILQERRKLYEWMLEPLFSVTRRSAP